jgi:hypothetical protein
MTTETVKMDARTMTEKYSEEQARKGELLGLIKEGEGNYQHQMSLFNEAMALDDKAKQKEISTAMKDLKARLEDWKGELATLEAESITLEGIEAKGREELASMKEGITNTAEMVTSLKGDYLDAIGALGQAWRDLFSFAAFLHATTGNRFNVGPAPEPGGFTLEEDEVHRVFGERPSILTYRTHAPKREEG